MDAVAKLMKALADLSKSNPAALASVLEDQSLEKAMDHLESAGLDAQKVEDNWTRGNLTSVPTKEEIKTGPTFTASGGSADAMNDHYSNNAAQHGIQLQAEALARLLGPMFHASSKSQIEALKSIVGGLSAIKTQISQMSVVKADEDDEDEEDDESEVVEINASKKAKALLAKAKTLSRKIAAMKDEMEDEEDDEEKCKALKAEIKALRKAAAVILGKARDAAYIVKGVSKAAGVELLNSVRKAAAKADVDVVQEEEEDDDDEEEAKSHSSELAALKAEIAALKAKKDDKGNQADRADPVTGNQADAAKSLTDVQAQVQSAVDGLQALSMNVAQMMEVVSGKSRLPDPVKIDIAKATVVAGDVMTRVDDMLENGQISQSDAVAAQDIAGKLELVKSGRMDAKSVEERLGKATTVVQHLFRSAA